MESSVESLNVHKPSLSTLNFNKRPSAGTHSGAGSGMKNGSKKRSTVEFSLLVAFKQPHMSRRALAMWCVC